MKIADLDLETKRVIVLARAVTREATPYNIGRLTAALESFDKKHEEERAVLLFNALWPKRKKEPHA